MRISESQSAVRVCHLGKFYPPAAGGIETHVRTLACAQAAIGMDVTVLCVNHLNRRGVDGTWARYGTTRTRYESDDCGVRVIRVGRSMTFARVDFCPRLPRIIRQLNGSPPDIFHLHTPNVTMLLTVAALTSSKVPLVITHHSDIVRQRFRRWALSPYERRVYKRAKAILVSAKSYAEGSELLIRHHDKLHVMPMGLDLEPYLSGGEEVEREAQRIRAELGTPLWLSVGRTVYYKGFDTAIEALREVPGRLLIIGRGPLKGTLQKQAERVRVADRITWWDYVGDAQLRAAYRAATALWFPSNARSESFGLVQVEAMASGCPVINTEIPHSGVAWVSPHGQTGLTVPVADAKALAAAARQLIDDPGLYQRLADGARRRAKDFSHSVMAERCASIYHRVLRQHSQTSRPAAQRLAEWIEQIERVTT